MLKRPWYYLVRAYVWLGLRFYFRKVVVKGASNIPKSGPVIFTANHQNAFLDALILATSTWRFTHYLVRADVFKRSCARKLLNTLNMMPIYRIRDGRSALDNNRAIFESCNKILGRGESLLIFPEGNHGQQRRLRSLSKGFTRVVFGAMDKLSGKNIPIVPVGLNYSRHREAGSSVSIYFGTPIDTTTFYNPAHPQRAAQMLKEEVAAQMSMLITHVPDKENHDLIIQQLEHSNPNYLDPVAINKRIASLEKTIYDENKRVKSRPIINRFIRLGIGLNNLIPLGLWYVIKSKIKDPVFNGSIKFCVGLVFVPLGYLFQSYIFYFLGGIWVAIGYVGFCLALLRWRSLLGHQ